MFEEIHGIKYMSMDKTNYTRVENEENWGEMML